MLFKHNKYLLAEDKYKNYQIIKCARCNIKMLNNYYTLTNSKISIHSSTSIPLCTDCGNDYYNWWWYNYWNGKYKKLLNEQENLRLKGLLSLTDIEYERFHHIDTLTPLRHNRKKFLKLNNFIIISSQLEKY